MQTTTARGIYEVLSRRIVVLSITFHGGTRAVGYPWGAPNHMEGRKSSEAPDKAAAHAIGVECISYSGISTAFGPMTDTVYEVAGGMEDWAYAASWEGTPSPVTYCRADNFTISSYNAWSFRQLMYLVEMDNDKDPPDSQMGEDLNVFTDSGLVPSYIRFSLAALTMAKPFIESYITPAAEVIWRVRGCETVDETYLLVHPYDSALLSRLRTANFTTAQDLEGFQMLGAKHTGNCSLTQHYTFRQPLDLNETSIVLVAAVVDKKWAIQHHPDPAVLPQSHIIHMRTDNGYYVQSEDFSLVSNSTSYSAPLLFNSTALAPPLIRLGAVLYDRNYQPQGLLEFEGNSEMKFIYLNITLTSPARADVSIGEFGDARNPTSPTWGHEIPLMRLSCQGVADVGYFTTPYEVTFDICIPNPLSHFVGRSAVVKTKEETLFGVLGVSEDNQNLAGGFSNEGVCVLSDKDGIIGKILLDADRDNSACELVGYFYFDPGSSKYAVRLGGMEVPLSLSAKEDSAYMSDRVTVQKSVKALFGRAITLTRDGTALSTCVTGVMNPGHDDPALGHSHYGTRKLYQNGYVISGGILVFLLAAGAAFWYCNAQKKNYSRLSEQRRVSV